MHVPGILSWPGTIPPRQQIHELAMSMDILPTLCKAAGATLPDGYTVDGSDILPVAAAQAASPHPSIFWAQNRSEEHTSELQSHSDLVCRLLLEKKKENE